MRKILSDEEKKINLISSEIEEIMDLWEGEDISDLLIPIRSILCAIDTDLAINVMEKIDTEESNEQALAIKVIYGY